MFSNLFWLLIYKIGHYLQANININNIYNININTVYIKIRINSFQATGLSHTPWKHEKTYDFPMFSGGIGRGQWNEMD